MTLVAKFATSSDSVVETVGKLATSAVSMIPAANYLPPVSTTPVVHLELQIFPQIIEKNWKRP
jgi:hypothetical protein